ncbi:MAG: carbohydrate kinase [Actinomycetota bacterium]|nr:carbohydrate kinase [Actinomycetota bacterium]
MTAPRAPGGTRVTVLGEALIDLVPGTVPGTFTASAGGSPYNVAIGLARLGVPTSLMARLADNALGRILRGGAETEGIDLTAAPLATEPTTLAVVSLDAQARASYDFYHQGTADWQWSADELSRVPEATSVLHFGSLASWLPPGEQRILDLAGRVRARGDVLVSYDPNVRPTLLGDPGHGRDAVERAVRIAHLVKASEEDIAWLYPGRPTAEVARQWLALGTNLVVITDGGRGAGAFTRPGPAIQRPAVEVTVADTVGAGDSFTAGLIAALIRRGRSSPPGLASLPVADLAAVLDEAIMVAALNCQRTGNDPPTAADLRAALAARAS